MLFVPKTEGERLEAGEERDGFNFLEQRLGFVAAFEVVVRDTRAQMMDVMEADVAGEPLKNFRQFVERTTMQCS